MPFLFERPPAAPAYPAFHDPPALDPDVARVPEHVWNALRLPAQERVALAIARSAGNGADSASGLPSITCWGVLDRDVKDVSLPRRWQVEYPNIFPSGQASASTAGPTHSVTAVKSVVLSEVILAALSEEAYSSALADTDALEEWLLTSDLVFREGATYTWTREANGSSVSLSPSLQYKLVMAAPVRQGVVERRVTKVYVSAPVEEEATLEDSDSIPTIPDGDLDGQLEPDASGSEAGEFEIGEDFLAGSVLRTLSLASPPGTPPSGVHPNGITNGATHTNTSLHLAQPERTYKAHPLQRRISESEDECAVYVRTSELSRIGVLDGDWAIIRSDRENNFRLARVHARDNIATSAGLYLSPQLLHNLRSQTGPNRSHDVCIRPSPFGARRPTIPVAKTVTIARVASAFSTDRAYQALFLQALQSHFKDTTRLVKQGDVIAVGINTDDSAPDGEDSDEGQDAPDTDTNASSEYNELVYFLVTNVEHSVPSRLGDVSSPDMYVGATVGELGCWVDPSATRMVQTGIEHSRVPDMARYLSITQRVLPPEDTVPDQDTAFGKLLALASAALNRRAVDYHLQLSILLQGPRGCGKATTAAWVAQRLGIHLLEVDCYDVLGDTDAKTEGTLQARFERAASCSPCILLLRHIDAFAQSTQGLEPGKEPAVGEVLRDCIASLQPSWNLTGFPVLLFGTTDSHERVPPKILSCFKHEVVFEAPGEAERHAILLSVLANCTLAPDVSVKDLAVQTAALVAADLVDLVNRAKAAAIQRSLDSSSSDAYSVFYSGIPLTAADFDLALGKARASYSESIGVPKIPSVSWDDVGGLAHVKADILDTIQLPLEHPELFADGLKQRSGVLLYGPPGTGKTLIAKAVATSCALNFFSVKGPELLNMYIGESEANVRRVFQRARDARPCVIFFDELDSVAPKRGNHGDSGGVMDRIVSQLLAELDGLSGGKAGADVFVIGATNRPDLLDPALLRPGRFDRMLYLGVSTTHEAQLNILQALTRKFRLHPDLKLERVAEQCPFHYTGADFYALCADALLKAMSRKAEELEAIIAKWNADPPANSPHPLLMTPQYYLGELATPAETEVLVSEEDFDAALRELVPSVSQAEMEHYARIQQRFSSQSLSESGTDKGKGKVVDKGKGRDTGKGKGKERA
ncbi:AAA-domain-containing protein [Cubamyces sp. BRFM 1775]|nr:AAA-domain-containing protein [Cubamyces sp. BRFM 1775]